MAPRDSEHRKPPRPTELDRTQTASLLIVLVGCVAATFIPHLAVKIIALIVLVSLIAGLTHRVWRDRTGR
ncbi:hypothetical protein ACGE24_03850 [Corynebacterium kroppenstedtii]|uniref:hypothetical protein n=1 Tax=Corynebacterium sp. PCR 32 TaxID=3351342 RepID=UPI0030B487A4